jgi:hypothetical protein
LPKQRSRLPGGLFVEQPGAAPISGDLPHLREMTLRSA